MRVRILMRMFQNPEQRTYLRELAAEFGASPSQVRDELQHLSEAGLISGTKSGRQTLYRANAQHVLFPELQSMVRKALGMDRILESIIARLGDLEQAILIDDYAAGKDSGLIDLVLVGDIDQGNLENLVQKTEKYIKRKIRTLVVAPAEFREFQRVLSGRPQLVLWSADGEGAAQR
jgi:DNA-binding MarR family transcriptional regulator